MMFTWWQADRPADNDAFTLAAVSDICASRGFEKRLLEKPLDQVIDPAISKVLRDADLTLANIETVLTELTDTMLPGYGLRASAKIAPVIAAMGVDVAALSNNHIRDVKDQGVLDTIAALQAAGMQTTGAGANITEAQRPWIGDVGGIKVGIYAVAQEEFNVASVTRAGSSRLDFRSLPEQVAAIKQQADVLVVFAHHGMEFLLTPSPDSVSGLRAAIDAGADAVIGHHPHVVQGVEMYNGKPIFYSLGNFLFDSDYVCSHEHWEKAFIPVLTFDRRGVTKVDLLPYIIDRTQGVTAMDAAASRDFNTWLRDISTVLADGAALRKQFRREARARFDKEILKPKFDNLSEQLAGDGRNFAARQWFNLLRCPSATEFLREVFATYGEDDPSWKHMVE
jgi:poly-gamma-glutamate synthesis protein (capsule biosynthesis protein)